MIGKAGIPGSMNEPFTPKRERSRNTVPPMASTLIAVPTTKALARATTTTSPNAIPSMSPIAATIPTAARLDPTWYPKKTPKNAPDRMAPSRPILRSRVQRVGSPPIAASSSGVPNLMVLESTASISFIPDHRPDVRSAAVRAS